MRRSQPDVDTTVRAAIARLGEAGLTVGEVSVPWHRQAMHVWNVIATDGVAAQMIDGNGYGYNWDGRYDPELIAYYGRQRREVADAWSETVKMAALTGRYSIEAYQARHYAMARNLVPQVRAAYNEALAEQNGGTGTGTGADDDDMGGMGTTMDDSTTIQGIEIIRALRGHTTGYATPIFCIDAPGGGGKIQLAPDPVAGRDGDYLLLKNFEGDIYRYPDPNGTLGA